MHVLVPRTVADLDAARETQRIDAGAALIVDVAGSTALAAALEGHGTVGAEALADVLAALFTPMVEQVAEHGGEIAGFAGDGILAVFAGNEADSVGRAVAAACGIASALRERSDHETPAGSVAVTARCVVGAGSIEWHVWRSDDTGVAQRATYACTGGAIDEAHTGEAVTPGGVVAVGPSAAEHLDPAFATFALDDGFLGLAVPSIAPEAAAPTPSAGAGTTPGGFFPADVDSLARRAEFREVVTVFVELADRAGEDFASMMSSILELLSERRGFLCDVVATEDGGVRLLALWGAPTSHEHDVGYAVRFATGVIDRSGDRRVRAGVTRTTAYAGFVGTAHQESYTAIGAGVNLAARMCASAAWNTVVVDTAVARSLGVHWSLEDLGERPYRGFAAPTPTFLVVGVPPVRRPDPFHGTFVGRGRELGLLADHLAPLQAGRPAGMIAVTGDAGVGKTGTLNVLAQRLASPDRGLTWLSAQADEVHTRPLATLRDALEGYFGRAGAEATARRLDDYIGDLGDTATDLAGELQRARRSLGDLLGLAPDVAAAASLDPRTRFENVVLAIEDLVIAAARSGPVVIAVADAHWLDAATAAVLDRIVADLGDVPVAVIVETRADAPTAAIASVDIPPLDTDEVARLAAELLGAEPPDELVAMLAEHTGGNTLYVRQLLEWLAERDLVGVHTTGAASSALLDEMPADLRTVLVARIDALEGPVRHTVQTASVLGREFDPVVLARVVDEPSAVARHVGEAIAARILDEHDGRFAFRERMVRDAAYSMLLHADARSLHRRAAEAIVAVDGDGDDTAAALAHHYERAEMATEAVDAHLRAASASARRYANAAAIGHVDRVLDLARDEPSTRYEALRLRYDIEDITGDRTAQERTLDQIDGLALDEAASTVAVLRGRLLVSLGRYDEAATVVDGATATLPEADSRGRAELDVIAAQLARHRGQPEQAATLLERARAAFASLGDLDRVATIDDFSGGLAWERGDFDDAVALHRAAAEAFRSSGRATEEIGALNNLGTAIFALGDYAAARSIHESGAARSKEIGYRMGEGDHLDNVGGTAWAVGDYDMAMTRYGEALAIRERMDDAWGMAISKGNMGSTLRALGSPRAALELYREALEIDRRIGRRRGEAYDLHGTGLCLLDLGDPSGAEEALATAAEIRFDLGEAHLANESRVARAAALARSGALDEARTLVEEALDDEGADDPFSGAVETSATLAMCIEVLEATDPARADELRAAAAARVAERAARISDPDQRASYLSAVASHRTLTARGEGA